MNTNYQLKELTGQVFGRFTVLERAAKIGRGSAWLCQCSCPEKTIKTIRQSDLISGKVSSCGCLKREVVAALNTTHGASAQDSQTPEYVVWRGIIYRCTNPKARETALYMGKGITICDEWRSDFNAFLRDMGLRPSPLHTCDRMDGSLGYFKDNCRWATRKEQANNRSSTIKITRNGITKSLKEWCEELNLSYGAVVARVYQHKWDTERALTTPIRKIDRREHLYAGRVIS